GANDNGRGNDRGASDRDANDRGAGDRQDDDEEGGSRRNRRRRGRDRDRQSGTGSQGNDGGAGGAGNQGNQGGQASQANQGNQSGTGSQSGQSHRGNQGQDRSGQGTGGRGSRHEPDLQILEDDVLAPCAGILDLMDNYAFVRTSGYLPGADDVYVSMSLVRKFGLRRGDAVVGQVRQPREGERKEKFNPLVRIDSVNGAEPDSARARVEFASLTPIHASERLRMETTPTNLIGRVIDVTAPIGKGQRGLIVSPSRAGKTTVLQSIATSVTANNPECHLMVVLVDERPEDVTDFQRVVKGEVVSSTFDRPPGDHTIVAELAIERAKRLVELGHDVVVLLDGLTRLARAYNLTGSSGGRTLPGGVDSSALHPPKRFFGAARNVEDGGSLTILATASVENGSRTDEVILEEFTGTATTELHLRREHADQRIFPAVDPVRSGTRREELLMGQEELAIVWKLRRGLAQMSGQEALGTLLARLRASQTNLEFLTQVQKDPVTPVAPAR
ncbi:MAG: transcription termination factor Rho, partial [Marmoricola sp.]|nr:transcription termination factor Rho [Marmoricola sp.]